MFLISDYRWLIAIPVFILSSLPTGIKAQQNTVHPEIAEQDSVLMRTSLYFSPNNGDWIEKSEYKKIGRFLRWALADTLPQIRLMGWADKGGTQAGNEQLSLCRARSVRNYLVKKGVASERIRFTGGGVDAEASDDAKARRVDMLGLAVVTAKKETTAEAVVPVVKEEKQVAVQPEAEKIETPVVPEAIEVAEPAATLNQVQPEKVPGNTSAPETDKRQYSPSHWYIGVGGGVSFGRATFCSMAMDKTRPGYNIGVLGGYRINKVFSAELSLDYTRMMLRTYDCCRNLWLASDGNRYFASLAGADNVQYKDLSTTTGLFAFGAHFNINLVSFWKKDSRWEALVSPAIYGVYSSAGVEQLSTGKDISDSHSFHFGMGADFSAGYRITRRFGLRLTTGIDYLTGKGMDGLPREEHRTNYVWNTSLKLIFKL